MTTIDKGLLAVLRHRQYLQNDPHLNKNFVKIMRPLSRKISQLLEDVDFTQLSQHDPHTSAARRMNRTGFLAKFLHDVDDARVYLAEATAKTIPTHDFAGHFAEFCQKKLPHKLASVTFSQLYRDNDTAVVIASPVKTTDIDKDVSPMVCFAFPFWTEDAQTANKLIKDFIDQAVEDGYFLSYFDTVKCKYHDNLPQDVSICYLTFEAKYTQLDVQLESNLFHVTTEEPLRSIAEHGLQPKAESKEFEYPPRIFLFNKADQKLIFEYGKAKARRLGKTVFYVIRVEKAKLEHSDLYQDGKIVLYLDPAFSQDDNSTDSTAVFTYDQIPIQLLNDNLAKYSVYSDKPTIVSLSSFRNT